MLEKSIGCMKFGVKVRDMHIAAQWKGLPGRETSRRASNRRSAVPFKASEMLNGKLVRIAIVFYALFFLGQRLFPVGLHYYVVWEAVGESLDAGAKAFDVKGPSLTEEVQEAVSKRVLTRAGEIGLPLEQEAIDISIRGTHLTVRVAWTEALNFWSFSWTPRLQVVRETAVL